MKARFVLVVVACALLAASVVQADDQLDALDAETSTLASDVSELESESAALDSGDSDAVTDEGSAAAVTTFTRLVACQTQVQADIDGAATFKTNGEQCSSNLATAELTLVEEGRSAQAEETERHKAKLEEQQALDAMADANALRQQEEDLKNQEQSNCDARKKQLEEAHQLALQNAKQASDLVDAQVAGAAATATSSATDIRLQTIADAQHQTNAAIAQIRAAMETAVADAQQEAADAVRNVRLDLNRTLDQVQAEWATTVQEAQINAATSVNKTILEGDEGVTNAEQAAEQAAEAIPVEQQKLTDAENAKATAEAARDAALKKKANYEAWAQTQLQASLAAVTRATDAAKMVALLVADTATAQSGAVMATPERAKL